MFFQQLTPLVWLFLESGFFLGFWAIIIINQRKTPALRKAQWLKFVTYFFITHGVIAVASLKAPYFLYLAISISLLGLFEIVRPLFTPHLKSASLALQFCALLIYLSLAAGFVYFANSTQSKKIIYIYLIICILDAYSQLTGQLLGKHLLAPNISPAKTIEGALGGMIFAVITALTLHSWVDFELLDACIIGFVVALCGISGDLLA